MRVIMETKFGSHLYGTSTPASDVDIKGVFIPSAQDILLQRARGVINTARPKGFAEKNFAGEVETEMFSLQRFLGLLAEGQLVALDMIFAPPEFYLSPPAPIWSEILANRHRLLCKRSTAFIGYVQKQAAKYGIRGSRVAATRQALDLLNNAMMNGYSTGEKLETLRPLIEKSIGDFSAIVETTSPAGAKIEMWEVCGRKMPMTASIKNASDIMARLFEEYGKRALMAEKQEGVDWKALSHAVRVGNEALELLRTGKITFPLINAAHILNIKMGYRPYQDVAAEIEELVTLVEAAAESSILPADPDLEWIDWFVFRVYRAEVI